MDLDPIVKGPEIQQTNESNNLWPLFTSFKNIQPVIFAWDF